MKTPWVALFVDSGVLDVAPTGTAASVTFLNFGFYGVKIYASSKLKAGSQHARLQGGQPITIASRRAIFVF